jgi:Holliday junction resolvase RusA-like endonuclease
MGKERARAAVYKSKKPGKGFGKSMVRMYTPSKTEKWEQWAAALIRNAIGSPMLTGPVRVDILAVFPRTQDMMRKKFPDRREWNTVKPDVDNIYKICGDSLTKAGALKDDCIIADSSLRKFIANKTEQPFTEITITELTDLDLPASAYPSEP